MLKMEKKESVLWCRVYAGKGQLHIYFSVSIAYTFKSPLMPTIQSCAKECQTYFPLFPTLPLIG